MLKREVESELLDQLSANDPVAVQMHRDILRYNRMLGNFDWMRRVLSDSLKRGDRVLEIAAGQGHLMEALSLDGLVERAGRVAAFDAACPKPDNCPAKVEWTVCRAEDFVEYRDFDIVLVCHFLHQLSDKALDHLGKQLSGARLILAAETRRHPLALGLCRASRLIGFSVAGIDDGLKSIRAGFRGKELKRLLQLDEASWKLMIKETMLGSYRLRADKVGQH